MPSSRAVSHSAPYPTSQAAPHSPNSSAPDGRVSVGAHPLRGDDRERVGEVRRGIGVGVAARRVVIAPPRGLHHKLVCTVLRIAWQPPVCPGGVQVASRDAAYAAGMTAPPPADARPDDRARPSGRAATARPSAPTAAGSPPRSGSSSACRSASPGSTRWSTSSTGSPPGPPLGDQTTTLNPSRSPRPWLDLTYQLLQVGFALVPVALALYLLSANGKSAVRRIGLDFTRPWRDLGDRRRARRAPSASPGSALYAVARTLGLAVEVQASALNAAWWTIPVLLLAALQNALLEEVIVVGYLMERLRELRWSAPAIVVTSALAARLVPPVPGLGRVRRERDHGPAVRRVLPRASGG